MIKLIERLDSIKIATNEVLSEERQALLEEKRYSLGDRSLWERQLDQGKKGGTVS
jgi:hypothetical protein